MTMVVTAPVRAASVRKVVSPGGIEAWLVEDYTVPLIAMEFAFPGGASQDAAERARRRLSPLGHARRGRRALRIRRRSTRRSTISRSSCISTRTATSSWARCKTLTRNGDEAFELLRLALAEPRFDEPDVERVKAQILAGLRREAKEPNAIARETFGASAFPNHPYGAAAQGTLETRALDRPRRSRGAAAPHLRAGRAEDRGRRRYRRGEARGGA